jgi:hypothetical protein
VWSVLNRVIQHAMTKDLEVVGASMPLQEREQAFLQALEALQSQWGVQLVSTVAMRQYGQMI